MNDLTHAMGELDLQEIAEAIRRRDLDQLFKAIAAFEARVDEAECNGTTTPKRAKWYRNQMRRIRVATSAGTEPPP